MISIFEIALAIPAFLLLVLAGFFALEVLGALLPARKPPTAAAPGAIAVVVPAHNESAAILPTIRNIQTQLRPADRLMVVADNCDDDTAEVVMRAGASCVIRNEPDRRGKGYALQFALDKMRDSPPEIVCFIDADCRLQDGALQKVCAAAAASDRPVQALYLMQAPAGAKAKTAVAEFAWLLLNRVRMSGLSTLFDVSRLTGAGMALPWRIAGGLDLATGEIVEDLALSYRLIEDGAAPALSPDAVVLSDFPLSENGAVTQHARWEHGSMHLALRRAPGLLGKAIAAGDIRLAAAALDLAVPPLTVFAAALAAVCLVSLPLLLADASLPFELAVSALTVFAAAVIGAWLVFGMTALPPEAIGGVFDYCLQKLRIYGDEGRGSTSSWTRTARDGENRTEPRHDS